MHQGAVNSACRKTPPFRRTTRSTSERASMRSISRRRSRALRRAQESAHLVEEAGPGGLVLQHQMVAAFERDETRAGNSSGQPAAFIEGLHRVAAAVQHEGRDLN